jgi:hypothetical protein
MADTACHKTLNNLRTQVTNLSASWYLSLNSHQPHDIACPKRAIDPKSADPSPLWWDPPPEIISRIQ